MKRIVPLCLVSLSTLAAAQEAPTPVTPISSSPTAPAASAPEAPAATGAANPAPAVASTTPASAPSVAADAAPGAPAPAPAASPALAPAPTTTTPAAAPAAQTPPPVAKPVAPVASTPAAAPSAPAPAAKPAATAAKPAAAPSAPAPKAAEKPADKSADAKSASEAKPSGEAKSEGEGSGGVQFHPGLSFGTVTVDGKTWTRLSLQPEIEIGKLGVAFDLEVFMDENQDISSRGWEFGSTREGVESVLRKIYYVRWDKPGATFYAKAGALDNVTLAHGLTVNNYRNTARYPDYKLLGLHSQLNDISSLGLDAEVLVNSFQDFSTQGPFWAGRLGFRPLKAVGLPIFKDLKVGGGMARDESQYSGLRDRDNDKCPDVVDAAAGDGSTCVGDMSYLINDGSQFPDTMLVKDARAKISATEKAASDSIANRYGKAMPFSQIWFDATLPLISTSFFELGIYGEYAKPLAPDDTLVEKELGWGAIPMGAWSKIGPVDLTAEYRMFRGPFQPGWFDAAYEIDRARQSGSSIVPKTQQLYAKGASKALLQGYFVGAHVDLWGMVEAGGDYSQLVASTDDPDLKSLSGKVGLGKSLLALVKNKVSMAEIYWRKDRIGLDTGSVGGVRWKDSFFSKSVYNAYGWRLGSQVAGGVVLTVQRETSFTRLEDGTLKPETQMAISSQMSF